MVRSRRTIQSGVMTGPRHLNAPAALPGAFLRHVSVEDGQGESDRGVTRPGQVHHVGNASIRRHYDPPHAPPFGIGLDFSQRLTVSHQGIAAPLQVLMTEHMAGAGNPIANVGGFGM